MDVPVLYVECHGIDPDRRRHPLPSWRETVQKFFSGRSNTSRATARSIGVVALLLACPPLTILGYRHIFGPSRYIEWDATRRKNQPQVATISLVSTTAS